MHMLSSNNCYTRINKPTRVGNNSNTIIDHVITKDTSNVIYPAIFTSDITDHFPVGCFVANPKLSTERVNIKEKIFFIRDMRRFCKYKLLTEMVKLLNYFVDINVAS